MEIKKERLEEIVKEELEAFYEGEVPVEEGVGSKIADVVKVMLRGQNPISQAASELPDPEEEELGRAPSQRQLRRKLHKAMNDLHQLNQKPKSPSLALKMAGLRKDIRNIKSDMEAYGYMDKPEV
tara:strand:+ start:819 stop:1193 length:375 start_codon:yes stop_codon:yes gene_type:complete